MEEALKNKTKNNWPGTLLSGQCVLVLCAGGWRGGGGTCAPALLPHPGVCAELECVWPRWWCAKMHLGRSEARVTATPGGSLCVALGVPERVWMWRGVLASDGTGVRVCMGGNLKAQPAGAEMGGYPSAAHPTPPQRGPIGVPGLRSHPRQEWGGEPPAEGDPVDPRARVPLGEGGGAGPRRGGSPGTPGRAPRRTERAPFPPRLPRGAHPCAQRDRGGAPDRQPRAPRPGREPHPGIPDTPEPAGAVEGVRHAERAGGCQAATPRPPEGAGARAPGWPAQVAGRGRRGQSPGPGAHGGPCDPQVRPPPRGPLRGRLPLFPGASRWRPRRLLPAAVPGAHARGPGAADGRAVPATHGLPTRLSAPRGRRAEAGEAAAAPAAGIGRRGPGGRRASGWGCRGGRAAGGRAAVAPRGSACGPGAVLGARTSLGTGRWAMGAGAEAGASPRRRIDKALMWRSPRPAPPPARPGPGGGAGVRRGPRTGLPAAHPPARGHREPHPSGLRPAAHRAAPSPISGRRPQ